MLKNIITEQHVYDYTVNDFIVYRVLPTIIRYFVVYRWKKEGLIQLLEKKL